MDDDNHFVTVQTYSEVTQIAFEESQIRGIFRLFIHGIFGFYIIEIYYIDREQKNVQVVK